MEKSLFEDKRTRAPIRIKSVILFLTLFGCLVFFILVNISVFWIIVAFIVAFAYYVAFANYFKDLGKKELVEVKE